MQVAGCGAPDNAGHLAGHPYTVCRAPFLFNLQICRSIACHYTRAVHFCTLCRLKGHGNITIQLCKKYSAAFSNCVSKYCNCMLQMVGKSPPVSRVSHTHYTCNSLAMCTLILLGQWSIPSVQRRKAVPAAHGGMIGGWGLEWAQGGMAVDRT